MAFLHRKFDIMEWKKVPSRTDSQDEDNTFLDDVVSYTPDSRPFKRLILASATLNLLLAGMLLYKSINSFPNAQLVFCEYLNHSS
jgi:hypothetical protein